LTNNNRSENMSNGNLSSPFRPKDRSGVRTIFDINHEKLGYEIVKSKDTYPFYTLLDKDAKILIKAHLEFYSSDFEIHNDTIKFCDLLICWIHDLAETKIPVLELSEAVLHHVKSPPLENKTGFRIILESDGVKIEEIPLSPKEWIENEIENDVKKLEKDIVDINLFFDAFTNPFRVKMLGRLMENEEFTLSFSDFLSELDMNPKSVREHAVKLIDAGLLGAPKRGKYLLSEEAQAKFILGGLALPKLLRILEEHGW